MAVIPAVLLSAPLCWALSTFPSLLLEVAWPARRQSTPAHLSALGSPAGMVEEGSWACGTWSPLCHRHFLPMRRWANASPS